MVKVVDKGERFCSITLDGSESSITFQEEYLYFSVQNNSDSVVYVSLNRDIVPNADGVMAVNAGSSVLFGHMKNANHFFAKGTGLIQIAAANEPINFFVNASTSGGGSTEGDYYTKAQSDAKYVQASNLADVAMSGSYSDLKDVPEKLPADGGNADTVGGHTVGCDVPEDAVFTPPDLSEYAQKIDVIPYKMGMDFGTCTTAAATVAKTATTLNKVAPSKGAVFAIKFTNSVPAQARLAVNGLTGYLYYRGSSIPAGIINAGDIVTFMYYASGGFNIFEILSIENGGNAKTVNGFTVGCNVPADAVFTPPDLSGYASKELYGDTTINVGRKAGSTVGEYSTAEGYETTASGTYSHAEGVRSVAEGQCSHAEGYHTYAGQYAHAESQGIANGWGSHAEGSGTANGELSHASGFDTVANNKYEAAYGAYNVSNENTLFSVGDGTSDNTRHNAFEITKAGGKLHDRDIGISITQAETGATRIEIPDSVDVAQWLVENAKSGMQYFISAKSSRTNLPNVSADWMWFSYDGNRYFARCWTGDVHTADFILDVVNSVGGWKEISYTPIESTTFSGTTNTYGDLIWMSASVGKVPLFVDVESKYGIPFRSVNNYWIHMTHATVNNYSQPAADVAVSGTVYYVEI